MAGARLGDPVCARARGAHGAGRRCAARPAVCARRRRALRRDPLAAAVRGHPLGRDGLRRLVRPDRQALDGQPAATHQCRQHLERPAARGPAHRVAYATTARAHAATARTPLPKQLPSPLLQRPRGTPNRRSHTGALRSCARQAPSSSPSASGRSRAVSYTHLTLPTICSV
eukprot:1328394-Prymnesium_polylepis.1